MEGGREFKSSFTPWKGGEGGGGVVVKVLSNAQGREGGGESTQFFSFLVLMQGT